VIAKDETKRSPRPDAIARAGDARSSELMETCLFSLTRAQSAAQ
jgi:hypothetical protein